MTYGITGGTAETSLLNFDAAALSGTTDNLQINLKDVVNDTITLTKETTDNTLETVTVNSSLEANTLADLQTTGVGATKLVIKVTRLSLLLLQSTLK